MVLPNVTENIVGQIKSIHHIWTATRSRKFQQRKESVRSCKYFEIGLQVKSCSTWIQISNWDQRGKLLSLENRKIFSFLGSIPPEGLISHQVILATSQTWADLQTTLTA